jgi:hypothetical protein
VASHDGTRHHRALRPCSACVESPRTRSSAAIRALAAAGTRSVDMGIMSATAPATLLDLRLHDCWIRPTRAAFSPSIRGSFMARTMARPATSLSSVGAARSPGSAPAICGPPHDLARCPAPRTTRAVPRGTSDEPVAAQPATGPAARRPRQRAGLVPRRPSFGDAFVLGPNFTTAAG